MKRKTKLVLIAILCLIAPAIYIASNLDREALMLNDTSLAPGDTMLVTCDIGSSPNVAIMLMSSDTVDCKVTTYYAYGNGQRISVAATDTVSAIGTTVPVSTGKVLRGYGLATDKVPGANKLYLKCYINAAPSSTGEYVKLSLITSK